MPNYPTQPRYTADVDAVIWLDIQQIVGATANLDLQRIRYWVKEFADALEAPELISDLDRLLVRE